jgi:hypothetical protein
MVPFFWTKHFDLSIRYVGHAAKWDETLVEGDRAHRNSLVPCAAPAAISLSLPSNATKTLFALSWRCKASPSGPREQVELLRTLDGTPVQHAGPPADQHGYRRPNGLAPMRKPSYISRSRRNIRRGACVRDDTRSSASGRRPFYEAAELSEVDDLTCKS